MSKPDIDFTLVKPANQKTTYTPHQIREIKKCMTDPLYFMQQYMWIQHPTKGKIPFEAYEYQKKLIDAYWNNTNVIAMLPRQSGKCLINSTIITIKQNSTGEIYDIPIGEYYEWAICMRRGETPPDLSQYKRNQNQSE